MTTQNSTAVNPSDLGALAVTLLKILTKTKNRVTSKAIRPESNRKKNNIFIKLDLYFLNASTYNAFREMMQGT